MNISDVMVIANLVLIVGGIIGGYIVIRSQVANSEQVIGDRVRDALVAENQLLADRLDRLEKENKHLTKVMRLITDTFKKTHGIIIEVDDEMIILREVGKTQVRRIPLDAPELN